MSILRMILWALALLAAAVAAGGRAAAAEAAPPDVARVTFEVGGWEAARLVAPGEWVPYG